MDDPSSILEAISVLFAAYLFLLERSSGALSVALQFLDEEDDNDVLGSSSRDTVLAAGWTREAAIVSLGLAVAPMIVSVIFLPVAVKITTHVSFDRPYSAVLAALLLIEVLWLATAAWSFRRWRRLWRLAKWTAAEAKYRTEAEAEYARQRRIDMAAARDTEIDPADLPSSKSDGPG